MAHDPKKSVGEAGGGGDGPIFGLPPDEHGKAALKKKKDELKAAGLPPSEPGGKGNGPIFKEKPEP